MKKSSLIASLVSLSIAPTSLLIFSSCSQKTYEFIVKTNFSKDEAEMDQTHGFAKENFESNITIKKNLKIHHIDVVVDGISLTIGEDYTFTETSLNVFHLHVNGTSIHIDDLQFNIFFESFEASFSTDDKVTAIENTLVTYDNDFITRIYLKPWSDIASIKVANSLTTLYQGTDYKIQKEGNVVSLIVFKASLKYSNLFISVSTCDMQFEPTITYSSYSHFEHSVNKVSFNRDFDITFVWWVSNLKINSIFISNSIRTFVENEDYTCYWFVNSFRIHIPKKSITYDQLTINVNAVRTEENPVAFNAFNIDYVQDSQGRFFPELVDFFSAVVSDENNILQIPDCIVKIRDQVFSGKLVDDRCQNITKLIFSKNLTSIGASAFQNCQFFNGELVIPSTVTEIGQSAFNHCSGFTALRFADDGKGSTNLKVGNNCFEECTGITQIDFSNFVDIPEFLKTGAQGKSNMFNKWSEEGKVLVKKGVKKDDWTKTLKDNGLPEKWTIVEKA